MSYGIEESFVEQNLRKSMKYSYKGPMKLKSHLLNGIGDDL